MSDFRCWSESNSSNNFLYQRTPRRRSAGVPPAFLRRPPAFRTRSAAGVPNPFRQRSAPVPYPFRTCTRSAPVPHRFRTGAAPVPPPFRSLRHGFAADPHGYPLISFLLGKVRVYFRRRSRRFYFIFIAVLGDCEVKKPFLVVLGRRHRAAHPPAFRTRSVRDPHCDPHLIRTWSELVPNLFCIFSALVPHLFRTCAELVPDLFRTCAALLPHLFRTFAALVPHLFRTCSAMWADLRRGVLRWLVLITPDPTRT